MSKAVTAWGKPTITSGPTGDKGVLSTTLTDVGKIKEDSTSLELVKGTVNELFGEGHELIDKMELEGTWSLKFTIVKTTLEKIAEIFGLDAPTAEKLPMKTTIVSEPRSYVVTPLLAGAIGAELPNSYTSLTPKFVAKEGWSVEVEATTMVPESESVAPATLFAKKASVAPASAPTSK